MQGFFKTLKYVAIALAGVAIVAGLMSREGLLGDRNSKRTDPGLISFAEFIKPIDPQMIGYRESAGFPLPFEQATALAVDSADNLYVAGDSSLLIFDSTGKQKSQIALQNKVFSLSVFAARIYLAQADCIQVLNLAGKPLERWSEVAAGVHFTSLLAMEQGVFAADARNKVIWHYDYNGKRIKAIGQRDMQKGKLGFIVPGPFFDIARGYADQLWAVNPGKHQLENYTIAGELRSSWRRVSVDIDGFCGCCNPVQIAILPDGAFVTCEKGIPRVKVHEPSGDLRTVVAGPDQFAEGTVIADVAVDSQNRVLVLDPVRKTVRVFKK